jgi:hypothetical protein
MSSGQVQAAAAAALKSINSSLCAQMVRLLGGIRMCLNASQPAVDNINPAGWLPQV